MQTESAIIEVNQSAAPTPADLRRMMWLNADRAVYCGLLGAPSMRSFGGFSIYLSIRGTHRISVDGGSWEDSQFSVVPPYVRHEIATGERMISNLLIESETVDMASLPDYVSQMRGPVRNEHAYARMRDCLIRFMHSDSRQVASTAEFDKLFFGAPLNNVPFDPRVQAVLDKIKLDPTGHVSAEKCAAASFLSVSRFLHLFSDEVGTPFRRFGTWKRARTVMYYVTQNTRLTDIALDVGYPDATHFSHCIRQVYGLTPKSIFAGSRKLALYADAAGYAAIA